MSRSIKPEDNARSPKKPEQAPETDVDNATAPAVVRPTEHGGQKGPEPTRYGDWEKNGRCTDF